MSAVGSGYVKICRNGCKQEDPTTALQYRFRELYSLVHASDALFKAPGKLELAHSAI